MTLMERRRALIGAQGSGLQHGTWEDLFYHIDKGDYATEYAVGEILPLDLGTEGVVNAEIAAFDADTITDSTAKAPVTFVTQYLLNSKRRFNPTLSGTTVGTGDVGGWEKCELRSVMNNTILPKYPQEIRNRMLSVKKYTYGWNDSAVKTNNMQSDDVIWAPSTRECCFTGGETLGPTYTVFNSNDKRIKSKIGGSAMVWQRRSSQSEMKSRDCVNTSGATYGASATGNTQGVLVGFCIGEVTA